MNVFDARVESFKPRRVPKNPSSKSTSSSSTILVKWPHPSTFKATPTTLADAGFVYAPSVSFKDNVICFFCGKELNDWGFDDDPAQVHFDKCGDFCSWASVKCGLVRDLDNHQQFVSADPSRLPSGKVLEKCRFDTFSSWPHDATKGHGANSKKMAKAGFVHAPQAQNDDSASCVYCGIILNGWEPDDDPMEEHHKRDRKAGTICTFFTAKPSTLGKSTSKGLAKSTSKPKSRSRSIRPKQATTETEQSSDAEVDTLRMSTRSTRSTKFRSDVAKTPASTGSRQLTSTTKRQAAVTGLEVDEHSGSETGKVPKSNVRKAKSKGRIGTIAEEEETTQVNEKELEQEKQMHKSKRSKGKVKEVFEDIEMEIAPEEPQERTRQTRRQTRSRAKAMLESDLKKSTTKPMRADSDSELSETPLQPEYVKPSTSGSRGKHPHPQALTKSEQLSAVHSDSSEVSNPPKKLSKSRPKTKPRLPESESEDTWQSALEDHEPEQFTRPTNQARKKPNSRLDPAKQATKAMVKPLSSIHDEEQEQRPKKPCSKAAPFHDKTSNQREHTDSRLRAGPQTAPKTSVGSKENATTSSGERHNELPVHQAIIDISDDAEDMSTKNSVPARNTPTTVISVSAAVDGSVVRTTKKTKKFEVVIERQSPKHRRGESQAENDHQDPDIAMEIVTDIERHPTPIFHSDNRLDVPGGNEGPRSSKRASVRTSLQELPHSQQRIIHLESTMDVDEQSPPEDWEGVQSRALSSTFHVEQSNPFLLPARDKDNPLFAFQAPYGKLPMETLFTLKEYEKDMTIEEWTKRELETQLEKFRSDGHRRIQEFKDRAAEVRRQIEAL